MLKQLAAEQRATGYRQPRLSLQTKAEAVTDEGAATPVELVDLSPNGAGFVHDGHFEVGKEFDLILAGGVKRRALLRWSRARRARLCLTDPLDRAELASPRPFQARPR